MIYFNCDYAEGACLEILEKLNETNFLQLPGYGEDVYSKRAKEEIKKLCESHAADVHFLIGGTQTNMIVISSILKSYQGVISADTGHINVHETGAIEATGHKVLVVPTSDGKLTSEDILKVYEEHYNDPVREHVVQPGMVYLSLPTEGGLLYSKRELESIYETCQKCHLPLYIDGARLGYGLVSPQNDLTLSDVAHLCDVFYIGGGKIGALIGEALVITNSNLQENFRYHMKQKGGLLLKGRLLGIQFDVLFENNLYFNLARHAVDLALELKDAIANSGYSFLYDSPTNQQFPILPNDLTNQLLHKYSFLVWKKIDENFSAVRLVTSWATKREDVLELIKDIENYKK